MYSRILVPIDGSAIASHALDEALKIARANGSEVQPLFVIDTPPVSGEASAAFYVDIRDAFAKEGAAVAAEAAARLKQAGVPGAPRVAEVELTGDDIAHRILKTAEEYGADLVVLGTHGRRGWRRLVLGSVAEHFLRLSRCPVLLVPARTVETHADAAQDRSNPQKEPS
ncbi:UspA domain-containing protein [Caballeronia arationis]|jgi:nucleotide-binding universal stress UspA family protein|uniref:Nucleotide-binding universal stress protein, UspA family n=1 Tax=Caballeronia arationis TaxID=1777142 RepID=A0A7Z7N7G5_9BURK|nr:universal stress protein [Caballeronia arationis]SAK95500.1 UspA domain-containing protein [Caballeronia arationis]SOE88963.1 Nucleotide-binding universal stress protein, UspA family [Caballeronia arationis]